MDPKKRIIHRFRGNATRGRNRIRHYFPSCCLLARPFGRKNCQRLILKKYKIVFSKILAGADCTAAAAQAAMLCSFLTAGNSYSFHFSEHQFFFASPARGKFGRDQFLFPKKTTKKLPM
jgi:hypothetical protein